jgi:hypothetical protein
LKVRFGLKSSKVIPLKQALLSSPSASKKLAKKIQIITKQRKALGFPIMYVYVNFILYNLWHYHLLFALDINSHNIFI